MTVHGAGAIDEFRAAIARNAGSALGPVAAEEAAALACARVLELARDAGEPGPVAVPSLDPLLEKLGVVEALRAAGAPLVGPDDAGWRDAVSACLVGVTGSVAAAAETGTVALGCGPGAPRAVSLLPDAHVCLVAASTVEATLEEAFARAVAPGLPPNLVWVSGPSRSADIEKRITLGVHGPRTLEAIIVDS